MWYMAALRTPMKMRAPIASATTDAAIRKRLRLKKGALGGLSGRGRATALILRLPAGGRLAPACSSGAIGMPPGAFNYTMVEYAQRLRARTEPNGRAYWSIVTARTSGRVEDRLWTAQTRAVRRRLPDIGLPERGSAKLNTLPRPGTLRTV